MDDKRRHPPTLAGDLVVRLHNRLPDTVTVARAAPLSGTCYEEIRRTTIAVPSDASIEVETALERQYLRVIPVLVRSADMPLESELPDPKIRLAGGADDVM